MFTIGNTLCTQWNMFMSACSITICKKTFLNLIILVIHFSGTDTKLLHSNRICGSWGRAGFVVDGKSPKDRIQLLSIIVVIRRRNTSATVILCHLALDFRYFHRGVNYALNKVSSYDQPQLVCPWMLWKIEKIGTKRGEIQNRCKIDSMSPASSLSLDIIEISRKIITKIKKVYSNLVNRYSLLHNKVKIGLFR